MFGGRGCGGGGDWGGPRGAARKEVFGLDATAQPLGRGKRCVPWIFTGGIGVDNRNGNVLAERGSWIGTRSHDNDSVNMTHKEGFEMVLFADLVTAGITQE